jgi:subtilisin family serine protease
VPHPDLASRVLAVHEWSRTNDWSDPTGHGTHVAGSLLGTGAASTSNQYRGVAPAAFLVFQCVGDATGAFSGMPDDLHDLFLQADAAGAAVHSHSWGTPLDSAYDVDALSADEFSYDHPTSLLVFAAGNAGVDRHSDGRIARRALPPPAPIALFAALA